MFNGDRKQTAEFCLSEFETFLRGLRDWNWDKAIHAEIHAAALFLCEDKNFEQLLRKEWEQAKTYRTLPPDASHLDYAVEAAPDFIQGFFYALITYMEAYKGRLS